VILSGRFACKVVQIVWDIEGMKRAWQEDEKVIAVLVVQGELGNPDIVVVGARRLSQSHFGLGKDWCEVDLGQILQHTREVARNVSQPQMNLENCWKECGKTTDPSFLGHNLRRKGLH